MWPARVTLALVALLPVLIQPAPAATIHVPSEQPTIQAGIDAAVAGDTVLVAAGTYQERDIRMTPDVCLRSETGEPASTRIDAGSHGRVVIFDIAVRSAIEGFTLTGGYVTTNDAYQGRGGGITIRHCSPRIRRCIIEGNHADAGGGGLSVLHSTAQIEECIFRGNSGVDGGAIFCNYASPRIAGSLLHDNDALVWGGAVCAQNESSPVLLYCTLARNEAWSGAGLWCVAWCNPRLENCIVAFGSQGEGIHVYDNPSVPSEATLACCDVFGNEGGNYGGAIQDPTGTSGNISVDPLFCDVPQSDFGLAGDSPCLPDQNECGELIGALGSGCGAGDVPDAASAAASAAWLSVRPHPVRTGAALEFDLPHGRLIDLSVFDLGGRHVRSLTTDVRFAPDRCLVRWDGCGQNGQPLPSGVYILRRATSVGVVSSRVVVAR